MVSHQSIPLDRFPVVIGPHYTTRRNELEKVRMGWWKRFHFSSKSSRTCSRGMKWFAKKLDKVPLDFIGLKKSLDA